MTFPQKSSPARRGGGASYNLTIERFRPTLRLLSVPACGHRPLNPGVTRLDTLPPSRPRSLRSGSTAARSRRAQGSTRQSPRARRGRNR